ncbi:uncharacterized protein LOC104894967 [Beta vulgaris subsp. vulgaris]|uniref:uncharacterized protein LOC104894967 n=1 Tax=Beta vulgaris subsp. vulgaris TaxID=3555 RepID=UPI00053FB456|nr:uncharacterized protein LOC104894967 [Beta vulgaris subsp. vulgaris]
MAGSSKAKVHSSAIAIDDCNTGIGKQFVSIKIGFEDVKDEIEYWENAVVCYVIGANPPFPVMDGFVRRIWGKYGIDKVGVVGKDFFLVGLKSQEQRDAILNGGFQFFDKKPMVVKAWHQDMNFQKETVKSIPTWIQLPRLDLKYKGESCLFKLVAGVGKPIKLDQATKAKDRLNFARILVEVDIDQQFPNSIMFENEKGEQMCQAIGYKWKPIIYGTCHGLGHETAQCYHETRKIKKIWIVKEKPVKSVEEFTLLANEVEHPDNAVTVEDEDELEADEEDESQDGEPPDFHG